MSEGKITDYLDDYEILENGPKGKEKEYRVVIGVRKNNHEDLYVVFRGTIWHSITNWTADFNIATEEDQIKKNVNCQQCKIHKGFQKVYNHYLGHQVKSAINKRLFHKDTNKDSKIKNLIFTGHSLGGALATVAAYKYITKKILNYEKLKNIEISLLTFGSPRVGNINFAEYMNQSGLKYNVRVIFRNDLVSSLPPKENLGQEYLHTGTEIICDGKTKPIKVGELNKDTCSKVSFSSFLLLSRAKDHVGYNDINVDDLVEKIKNTTTLPMKADFIRERPHKSI
jgi:predicted lipase